MQITRDVRFSLTAAEPRGPVSNSWAGWPSADGLNPYLVLRVTVGGAVDPATGYVCSISIIDAVVRERAIPFLRNSWLAAPGGSMAVESLLPELARRVGGELSAGVELLGLRLQVTPWLTHGWRAGGAEMVTLTESFEFAAAHRLYCPQRSAEENARIFGKCANPNGHGHNYLLEVTVGGTPEPGAGRIVAVGVLEETVRREVIDVFDHKHLNADCAEFAHLNPTVENITRVIWDRLDGHFGKARLVSVRVYETPKTMAEYRGE